MFLCLLVASCLWVSIPCGSRGCVHKATTECVLNEFARNPVGSTASCLAGRAQEELAREASPGEADVPVPVGISFGCFSMATGFMPLVSIVRQLSS